MAYKSIRRYLSGVRRSWTRRGLLVPITYIFFGAFMYVLGFLPVEYPSLLWLPISVGGGMLCLGSILMLLVAGDNVEWISKFYFDLALKAGYKASDDEIKGLRKSVKRFHQFTAIIVLVYCFLYMYALYLLVLHEIISLDDVPSFAIGYLITLLFILFPINIHLNKRYGCDRLVQVANEYAMKHEEENEI